MKTPKIRLARNVTRAASGLHVVHAAAVLLGKMPKTTKPADVITKVADHEMRARIESALVKKGLVEKHVRALAEACGMELYRPNKYPFDPFKPETSDHGYYAALIGDRSERRYVLVLDHREHALVLADPAGAGVTTVTSEQFLEVWKLAARNGVSWAGDLWVERRRPLK